MQGNGTFTWRKLSFITLTLLLLISIGTVAPAAQTGPVDASELQRELTDEQWLDDLDLIIDRLKSTHPDLYRRVSRENFQSKLAEIKRSLPGLSDGEIVVEVMKLVAMIHDGHTGIIPMDPGRYGRWFPVRLRSFADGTYIVAADSSLARLPGCRVLKIGGMAADDAWDTIHSITPADGPYGVENFGPVLLMCADLMEDCGITDSSDYLSLTLESSTNEIATVQVPSIPSDPDFIFGAEHPFNGPAGSESVTSLAKLDLPLHLKRMIPTITNYWYEHLEDRKTLYFQFNSCQQQDQDFSSFLEGMWKFCDANSGEIEKLVIDLRYNLGGSGEMMLPLLHGIIKRDSINQRGSLYVITGNRTFSAAMIGVGLLKRHTDAIFVGEPTASGVNLCSDFEMTMLPNSKMLLFVSALYWQYGHPSDNSDHFMPDHNIPTNAVDFFQGRDPLLEAVLENRLQ